jgi:hypothetical protein
VVLVIGVAAGGCLKRNFHKNPNGFDFQNVGQSFSCKSKSCRFSHFFILKAPIRNTPIATHSFSSTTTAVTHCALPQHISLFKQL